MIPMLKFRTVGVVPSDIGDLRVERQKDGFAVSRADGKPIKDGKSVFDQYFISRSVIGGVDVKGMVGIGPKRAKFFYHRARTAPRSEVLNAALNFCQNTCALR